MHKRISVLRMPGLFVWACYITRTHSLCYVNQWGKRFITFGRAIQPRY